MRRAGRFAADTLCARWAGTNKVGVWCGSGNNAGDGYVLAGILHNRGIKVGIRQVGNVSKLSADANVARQWMHEQGVDFSDDQCEDEDVVVDALLGTGMSGELRQDYVEAVNCINAASGHVLALDIPTGIQAGTGGVLTNQPVRADVTTTFVGRKIGLYTGAGVDHAGQVVYSDLDVPQEVHEQVQGIKIIPTCDAESALPRRTKGTHKNRLGHVLIVGGNLHTGGAAILSAEGALRTGAGLISVVTHAEHVGPILARLPEVMAAEFQLGDDISQFFDRADVVVVGPGLGQDGWGRELLAQTLVSVKPIIMDADALNLLGKQSVDLPSDVILTPHPGEAARLLKVDANDVAQDRLRAVREISDRFKATVVLKGAGSIVARNGEIHGICDQANPALATAGSGDVLAGIIGACRAQLNDDLNAASLGVWLHVQAGIRAAQLAEGRAVAASDIAKAIRPWG